MREAIVLGGNGMVGCAAASALVAAGWRVTTSGRSAERFPVELRDAGVQFVHSDRADPAELTDLLGRGADLVVDCVGYTEADARALLRHRAGFGAVVFVSSKAVYVDDRGRHSNSEQPPDYGGPVTEDQATLAPADATTDPRAQYGADKVAAEQVLLAGDLPVSVLRPSRIHGRHARRPREWFFVRRVLEQRPQVFLAHRGRGVNHPTAAANLAALIAFCADRPATRVLNAADPDAPDGRQIARTIASHLGHPWEEVLLDDDAPAGLGAHPWNSWPPVVLDTSASVRAGYSPVGDYATTVADDVDWLVDAVRTGDPRGVLPADDDPYFAAFDADDAEAAWLAAGRP